MVEGAAAEETGFPGYGTGEVEGVAVDPWVLEVDEGVDRAGFQAGNMLHGLWDRGGRKSGRSSEG